MEDRVAGNKPNDWLDKAQGVLGLAGFIPGIGAIADTANAAIYGLRGRPQDAMWSLASAVPGIGDIAGAGRMAKQGLGWLGKAGETAKMM